MHCPLRAIVAPREPSPGGSKHQQAKPFIVEIKPSRKRKPIDRENSIWGQTTTCDGSLHAHRDRRSRVVGRSSEPLVGRVGLQRMQESHGPLRMRSRLEDRPSVVGQDLEPGIEVGCVVGAGLELGNNPQIGAQEATAELGDQFFGARSDLSLA
ncbi:hypothetical protein RGCCGE502_33941 (plasmid) [Rhizobium grahamii CCGE 502]|uniref:Uncharacterized protein n=1 Tax=Rhizobium grahamii CCGE 502 TaxID=990285 RepID=S3HK56_9HYPH|nr:hypothetical protein RGCCGE502_33941 [Rhizobium grahamii CCGE 502]